METEFEINCPFCNERIWIEFYPEDGDEQEMIVDCEVCCNPILYNISFRGDEPVLNVECAQ
jgi:hypothetical protein